MPKWRRCIPYMVLLMVIPFEREEFIRKDTLIVFYLIAELFQTYIVVSARPILSKCEIWALVKKMTIAKPVEKI
nr:unnamed protein product [Callosobruchus chinensis]